MSFALAVLWSVLDSATYVEVPGIDRPEGLPGQRADKTYSRRSSLYLAAGLGVPKRARFELRYNFGTMVSLAVSFGIGHNWSREPAKGTFAVLGSFRFPASSPPVTPYLLLCTGSTLTIPGQSDTSTLLFVGTMVELRSGIHLGENTSWKNSYLHAT